jgi:hypothetical protein
LLAIVFYNIFSNALFFYHERLLFPIIPVILIWAALGSVRLGRWMKATLGGLGLQLSHRSFVQLGWALLIILSLLFVANDFRLAGQSYAITALYEKEMGIALRSYVPQDARIMADNPFIPYYFFEDQQDYRFVPYAEPDALISYAIANEVEYIIITDWMTTDLGFPIAELFESSLPEDLKLIHEWMFDSGHRARLFNLELEEFMGE